MLEELNRLNVVSRDEVEHALKELTRQPAWAFVQRCLIIHCEDLKDRLATGRFESLAEVAKLQGKHEVLSHLLDAPVGFLTMLIDT
jgi:hypothetical protein